MKLFESGAYFIRYECRMETHDYVQDDGSVEPETRPNDYFVPCLFAEAHGITFRCPKDPRGHSIQVFFAGSPVPPHIGTNKNGETVRWKKTGTGLTDLTLTPSIQEESECGWHGYVTNGEAR